jgi:hypothetical protein
MRRKGTADVDALRTVEVVVSFQLDSLVVVGCHVKAHVCMYLDVQCFPYISEFLEVSGHDASSAGLLAYAVGRHITGADEPATGACKQHCYTDHEAQGLVPA